MASWSWRWIGTAALEPATAMPTPDRPDLLAEERLGLQDLSGLGRELARKHARRWQAGERGREAVQGIASAIELRLRLRASVLALVDDARPVTSASHLEEFVDSDRLLGVGARQVAVDVAAGLSRVPTAGLADESLTKAIEVLGVSAWLALASRRVQALQRDQARGRQPIELERLAPMWRQAAHWGEEVMRRGRSVAAERWALGATGTILEGVRAELGPGAAARPAGRRTPPPASPDLRCHWIGTGTLLGRGPAGVYVSVTEVSPLPTQLHRFGADLATDHPDLSWGYAGRSGRRLDTDLVAAAAAGMRRLLGARLVVIEATPPPRRKPPDGEIQLDASDFSVNYSHQPTGDGVDTSPMASVRLGAHIGAHQAQPARIRVLHERRRSGQLPEDLREFSPFWQQLQEWETDLVRRLGHRESSLERWASGVAEAVANGYRREMEVRNLYLKRHDGGIRFEFGDGSFDPRGH
ncbi:MAG TPA: hypothetical protein VIA06_15765 [Candidatus Dormibacteraeota bacterium]|jgi:hypothetical protein|nr:hypothetical protein [Candidatus Dormibacteraeota bacterium]